MSFLPGRKVVTRAPHRRVGYVSFPWLQSQQIAYESLLEQSFVHIALLCPGLRSIQAQPFTLRLDDSTHYTPDFLLTFERERRLVVEVKPSQFVPTHKRKLESAEATLRERGFAFLICTELEIQPSDRHKRASFLKRHANLPLAESSWAAILNAGSALPLPTSVSAVAHRTGLHPTYVRSAIARGALRLPSNLFEDALYAHDHLEDSDHDLFHRAAWLSNQDR